MNIFCLVYITLDLCLLHSHLCEHTGPVTDLESWVLSSPCCLWATWPWSVSPPVRSWRQRSSLPTACFTRQPSVSLSWVGAKLRGLQMCQSGSLPLLLLMLAQCPCLSPSCTLWHETSAAANTKLLWPSNHHLPPHKGSRPFSVLHVQQTASLALLRNPTPYHPHFPENFPRGPPSCVSQKHVSS